MAQYAVAHNGKRIAHLDRPGGGLICLIDRNDGFDILAFEG